MARNTRDYTFNIPVNFIYDNTLVRVSGGSTGLLDLRPSDATFYANYSTNQNANWGDGVLTGTLNGGATVVGGRLDVTGFTGKYCSYDAQLNANSAQVGCIRFRVIPNYNGSPASNNRLLSIARGDGTLSNVIEITHLNAGSILLTIYNDAAAAIMNVTLAAWAPVSGTIYEIELNYDLTVGATRLFIDGTQLGLTQAATGTRNATNINNIYLGTNSDLTGDSNHSYEDMIIYSTVQHTANYTPDWSGIPNTIYSTTNPYVRNNSTALEVDEIESITLTSSVSGSDEIRVAMEVDGSDVYWDGSAWSSSTGYLQTNTIAEINNNLDTLLTDTSDIRWILYLHSDDGSTTPIVSNVRIIYKFIDLVFGTNTWATVEYADNYFEERFNNTWEDLLEVTKKQLLVHAYRWILREPSLNVSPTSTEDIVKQAQCELAWYIYSFFESHEKRRALYIQGVTKFKISSFSEDLQGAGFPDFIKDILEDSLTGVGGYFPEVTRDFDSNQSI